MKKITLILAFALLTISCSDHKSNNTSEELVALRTEIDSLKKLQTQTPPERKEQIATFLTFQESNAEEAMNFYVGLFENSKIIDVQRYGNEGPAKEGTIFFCNIRVEWKPVCLQW